MDDDLLLLRLEIERLKKRLDDMNTWSHAMAKVMVLVLKDLWGEEFVREALEGAFREQAGKN